MIDSAIIKFTAASTAAAFSVFGIHLAQVSELPKVIEGGAWATFASCLISAVIVLWRDNRRITESRLDAEKESHERTRKFNETLENMVDTTNRTNQDLLAAISRVHNQQRRRQDEKDTTTNDSYND